MEDLEQLFLPSSFLNWFSENCWECHKERMLGMSESEVRLVKPRTAEISKKKIPVKSSMFLNCLLIYPFHFMCYLATWVFNKSILPTHLLKENIIEEIQSVFACLSFYVKIKIQLNKQEVRFTIVLLSLMGRLGGGRWWNWICWICVVRAEW